MHVNEPARTIPVVQDVDICVVGGSCTGVFAAVRAARLGASVAVVEKQNCFGGMATAGFVNIWHSLYDEPTQKQIIAGMTVEMLDRMAARGAVAKVGGNCHCFNSEELKIELDDAVLSHGITAYLHTYYAAPFVEDGVLKGIVVENKNGRQAIAAGVVIDATGDGDVARALGCESYLDESLQPPTPCCKLFGMESLGDWNWEEAVNEHGAEFGLPEDWGWHCAVPGVPGLEMHADTHVFDVNASDATQLTAAEMEGRRQIRAILDVIRTYGPAEANVGLAGLAASIGIRETDRIQAAYRLTGEDVLNGTAFDDAIAFGSYRVDIHHSDGPGITFRYLNGKERIIPRRGGEPQVGRWREQTPTNPTYYQVPYRCLLQDRYPNLLLAGRMLDADKTAFSAVRVMVNMNQTGEAAGVAAWLSLDSGTTVQDVDVQKVRSILEDGGSIIPQ